MARKKFNPFTRKFDYVGDTTAVASPIPVFIQPLEPTLATNQSIGIWEDTTSGRKLMIYKDSVGNQTSVEMA